MWGYGVKGGIAFLLRALFSGYLLRYDNARVADFASAHHLSSDPRSG